MFFYLAKTFWFFAQPLNLAIFLSFAGLVAGLFGRRRLAATGGALGVLVLVLSAWTSFGAMLMIPLEERFHRPAALPQRVDGIVVLGGGMEGAINLVRGGYELNRGGDRFVEALRLARLYPDARILISGGVGTVLLNGEGDADTAVRLFADFGFPRERLVIESQSRDTAENARLSKALVNPQPGETWLLVTSAFHMPRSIGSFRKAGVDVIAAPTDWMVDDNRPLLTMNAIDRLGRLDLGVHEYLGLIAYWVTGRTSGIPRTTPLLCVPDRDTWLIAGSYFGGPRMPLWVGNLRAADFGEVSIGGRRTRVRADELEGAERAAAWRVMLRTWPNFAVYEERTDRVIPDRMP